MKIATTFPVARKQPKAAYVLLTGAMVLAGTTSALADTYYGNTADNSYYSNGSAYNTDRTYYNDQRDRAYNDQRYNTQRDPKYATNSTADCVHGGTGVAENLDCTRNHASRHTNDISSSTDTGFANGNPAYREPPPNNRMYQSYNEPRYGDPAYTDSRYRY